MWTSTVLFTVVLASLFKVAECNPLTSSYFFWIGLGFAVIIIGTMVLCVCYNVIMNPQGRRRVAATSLATTTGGGTTDQGKPVPAQPAPVPGTGLGYSDPAYPPPPANYSAPANGMPGFGQGYGLGQGHGFGQMSGQPQNQVQWAYGPGVNPQGQTQPTDPYAAAAQNC